MGFSHRSLNTLPEKQRNLSNVDKMFSMNTAQAVESNCLMYLSEIIINSNISFSLMTEEYKMGKLNIVGLENSKYKTYNWSFLG